MCLDCLLNVDRFYMIAMLMIQMLDNIVSYIMVTWDEPMVSMSFIIHNRDVEVGRKITLTNFVEPIFFWTRHFFSVQHNIFAGKPKLRNEKLSHLVIVSICFFFGDETTDCRLN